MSLRGWLLDVRICERGARLLFKGEDGGRQELFDSYLPHFHMVCKDPHEAAHMASNHPHVVRASVESRLPRLGGRDERQVVKVMVESILSFKKVVADVRRIPGLEELMETSFPHYFRYLLGRGLSFFSDYIVEAEGERLVSAEKAGESLPRLECAAVDFAGKEFTSRNVSAGFRSSSELLSMLGPADVVFTFGESPLRFPGKLHIDIRRELGVDIYAQEDVPRDAAAILSLGKRRLIRIIELSAISGARPDIVARVSPGRLNTYLHIAAAKREGYLIPDVKRSMERPKSLRLLQAMDKGGLILYPQPGLYSDVAKCDFASMYPNIIVRYNISPETMHCGHEDCTTVPEANWRICRRRRGVIPQGIGEVLERRLALKRLMKLERDPGERMVLDLRQKALKNILVVSFGFLGFKNFIFSNVECKECVMLYGRHILMRTKEMAEECGLEVIYGIVDSVFVRGGTKRQYEEFVEMVSREVGIELELDRIFSKIAFPCAEDSSGIANKYYGVDYDGGLEARGIAFRHSDAPPIIKGFQEKAARLLLSGDTARAHGLYREYGERIMRKDFQLQDFAIMKSLRRHPDDYAANAPHVVAFRQSPNPEGISSFVYTVRGPRPLAHAAMPELHTGSYLEMLERSFEELTRGIIGRKSGERLTDFC